MTNPPPTATPKAPESAAIPQREIARWRRVTLLVMLAVAAVLASPWFGVAGTILPDWSASPGSLSILVQLRWPRVLLAAAAGASLAVMGAVYQSLFRNPLAEPYTLGVASGAALGATVAVWLAPTLSAVVPGGIGRLTELGELVAGALVGGVIISLLVWRLADHLRAQGPVALLLAGVALSYLCASGVQGLLSQMDAQTAQRLQVWSAASVQTIGWTRVNLVVATGAVGLTIVLRYRRELDLLMMGDLLAATRGVDVPRVQRRLGLVAALVTSVVVACCGPVAFVGLLGPHLARAAVGATHRGLIPASAAAGALLLVLCDLLARSVLAELPLGVVCHFFGGLFFLVILLRSNSARGLVG